MVANGYIKKKERKLQICFHHSILTLPPYCQIFYSHIARCFSTILPEIFNAILPAFYRHIARFLTIILPDVFNAILSDIFNAILSFFTAILPDFLSQYRQIFTNILPDFLPSYCQIFFTKFSQYKTRDPLQVEGYC